MKKKQKAQTAKLNTQQVRTHIFRNHRWIIKSSNQAPKGLLGCTEYGKQNILYIPTDGDTRNELDTVIHESLHACTELDEDAVDTTATNIANLLWRLNWRKADDNDD